MVDRCSAPFGFGDHIVRSFIKSLVVLFSMLGCTATMAASGVAQRVFLLEPERSRIAGVLTEEIHYGPPNYGENPSSDQKMKVLVLVVSPAVWVKLPDDPRPLETKRIQLIVNGPSTLKNLVGEYVEIAGRLFLAEGGQHVTPILMMVDSIH